MYIDHSISPSTTQLLNGFTPKSTPKIPIEQTYISSEAELIRSDGSYQFKIPELFSSTRSGHKSFCCRSIKWLSRRRYLDFTFCIHWTRVIPRLASEGVEITESEAWTIRERTPTIELLGDEYDYNYRELVYRQSIDNNKSTLQILDDITANITKYIKQLVSV